jgi:hypothetical protein
MKIVDKKNRFFSPTGTRAVRRFIPMMWIDQVKKLFKYFFFLFIVF